MRGYDHRGVLVLSMVFARERIMWTPEWHFSRSGADQACWHCSRTFSITAWQWCAGWSDLHDTVDAKIIAGRTKQWFRVRYWRTGDHSLGLGASAFGRTENLMVLWPRPVAVGVIYARENGETAPNDESINTAPAKGLAN